jgi:hypothetical protein
MKRRGHNHSMSYWPREYLFWLCAVWTIVQMASIAAEFFGSRIVKFPPTMPLYNFLLVSVYALIKEGARWAQKKLGKKPGEYFFVAWWLFTLMLFTASALTQHRYEVPHGAYANCWFVSVVYVASTLSKLLHALTRVHIHIHHSKGTHTHAR